MDCHATRDLLEEYRRGELGPDRARAVEAHLRACPACQGLHAADDALAALLRSLPRTPAPAALARQVRALGQTRSGVRHWLARPAVAAALAALAVAAVLAPWARWSLQRRPDAVDLLIQSGVSEHRRILLEVEAGLSSVPDAEATFRRVYEVTDVPLAKAFAGSGDLRLVAARPTLLASRKTAAATLRYKAAPVTTYFVLDGKDLPMPAEGRVQIDRYRPYMRQADGFNVIYWKQGDLAYLMVSGLDREGCQKLFLKMRQAL
jgi:anti-sigma factor RsiW